MLKVAASQEVPLRPHTLGRCMTEYADVYVQLFGKPDNWSLSPLQEDGDQYEHPELAARLSAALAVAGVQRAFATSPTKFNAEMVRQEDLHKRIMLPDLLLFRNNMRPADGTELLPLDAGLISTGGCPVIVMVWRERVRYAHAGRDCLIDRVYIEHEGRHRGMFRKHGSVCDALVDSIGVPRELRHEVSVWVFGSITPKDFPHPLNHPKHGTFNRQLHYFLRRARRYPSDCALASNDVLYLDLPKLIRAQLCMLGLRDDHIHTLGAYLEGGDVWLDGTPGAGRNLLVVARTR